MQQTRSRPVPTSAPRDTGTAEARRLRHDLRQSVRHGAFTLVFQARRRLDDHAPLGAEAHVKWPSRGRGVVQASALMPLVDECGLGRQLLAWTLDSACRAARGWPEGTVSVSVPASAAQDGSLLALAGEALAASDLDPERIEISLHDADVTADCADTILALSALRDLGVGVALEEYGRTGACLLKLKHLPLTAIKLDCSMVRDVPFDRAAASMVGTLIGFAHALDIAVAAGVETPAQRSVLKHLGCDAGIERSFVQAPGA
jgi:EAL domain-containing protein (putative c-di-GMP-specific phosphodiesterase class I)